jgi:TolB protein
MHILHRVATRFFLMGFAILLADASWPPIAHADDVPRLTIASKHFGGIQIMTVGIDGSKPQQLTNEPDAATQPTWCPDGSKLCYVVGERMHGKLKIMDADGKNAHLLFDGDGSQRTPQWSPDGKQIAFSMEVGHNFNYEIFVINADGTELKNISNSPLFDADPAWSPDGSKIAFAKAIIGGGHFPGIWIMKPDGSEQTDLLGHELNSAVYPTWSADGKQITYGGPDDSGQIQVMQVNADGKGNLVLTHGPKQHSYAAWSPDGQYLAYVSDPGQENGDLCIYDVVAGEHRTVLEGEVFQELFRDARPSWVPKAAK